MLEPSSLCRRPSTPNNVYVVRASPLRVALLVTEFQLAYASVDSISRSSSPGPIATQVPNIVRHFDRLAAFGFQYFVHNIPIC